MGLQVWNLNNLDADVLHANEIIKGAVKSVAVSSSAGIVACHGGVQGQAEVKLVETSTGRVVGSLQQAAHVEHVSSVTLSASGRYLLTHNVWAPHDGSEEREATLDWPLLRCVVLWDADKYKAVASKVNSRFAFFDRHGSSLGVVQCMYHSQFDWTFNLYKFFFRHLDSEVSGQREQQFDLPECTEFLGPPILFYDRRSYTWAFVAVLQYCQRSYQRPGLEGPRTFESVVYIRHLSQGGGGGGGENKNFLPPEAKLLHLNDLLRYPDEKDRIANVKLTKTNLLFITYVKGTEHFVFDTSRGLVVPPDVEKGSVVYDLMKDVVVKHSMRVYSPSSDLLHMKISHCFSLGVDQDLQVFDMVSNRLQCKVAADWRPGSARLALDGRYLVGLTSDCRSLQVYRTADGIVKGSLLVHGKATHLEVAEDGRTIAVGTSDGRVMLLSLVLDLSDPYVELIQHFPSRNPPPPPSLNGDGSESKMGGLLVDKDAQIIRGTTPELQRLSAKIRSDVQMACRRQPSFRSITNAMVVAQKFQQARSQACCIQ